MRAASIRGEDCLVTSLCPQQF